MTKLLQFTLISRRPGDTPHPTILSGGDYEKLIKAFPEFEVPATIHKVTHFGINLPEGHPKLTEVFEFITREFGLIPILSKIQQKRVPADDPHHFTVYTRYEFDEQDIENAAFLYMSSSAEFKRDRKLGLAAWRYEFEKPPRKPLPLIGYMEDVAGEICTDATRAELEHEGFPGLDFLPITVNNDPRYPDGVFWRIWANHTMPKVTMPLCDLDGNPVKDDYSTGCMPDEIITNQVILKYQTADLAAMSSTDFALTTEKWWSPMSRNRREYLVVSQRVRQWSLKRNVQADWTPVIALPD